MNSGWEADSQRDYPRSVYLFSRSLPSNRMCREEGCPASVTAFDLGARPNPCCHPGPMVGSHARSTSRPTCNVGELLGTPLLAAVAGVPIQPLRAGCATRRAIARGKEDTIELFIDSSLLGRPYGLSRLLAVAFGRRVIWRTNAPDPDVGV